MLKQRIVTAVAGIPIVVAAIWFGGLWFTLLLVTCGLVGIYEFYRMVLPRKISFLPVFGAIWTVLFIINPYCIFRFHLNYTFLTQALFASAVVIPLTSILFRKQKEGAFAGWAWTIAGILYIGWLLSHLVAMRQLYYTGIDSIDNFKDYGRNLVFLTLFANFACDTAAFFVGRTFGKHFLAPTISPKKTWEGAVSGFLGAIAACLLLRFFLPLPGGYLHAAIIGILIGIFGQVGDLAESLLKRNTGVKDAGNLLPGHGGILDRLDSIVFVSVVVYYYVVWGI